MPGSSDPSRIYDDPALTDRRGDATGPVALLFLALLVGAFAIAAYGMVTFLPVAADPTHRPATTANGTPRPTPTLLLTPAPSDGADPSTPPGLSTSAEPGTSQGPLPSRKPGATASPPPPSTGGIDDALPIVRDGKRLGTVTMRAFAVGEVPSVDLPSGARTMVMEVTYTSVAGMPYDAADWVVVGADGKRYPSLGAEAPAPALGSGRLSAGGSVTGRVAFIRKRKVSLVSIVLTDGRGTDLVVVARPVNP